MDKYPQKTIKKIKCPALNFLIHHQLAKENHVFSAQRNIPNLPRKTPRDIIQREREITRLDFSSNRTVSPLSISPNRFSFSADVDEASDLAEKALNGEFPELPKKFPPTICNNLKKPAESSKINKKPLFLKNVKFIQNEKQLRELFYEINPDISFTKSTFCPSGNIKLFPKTIRDYQLISNYAFSSAIYRLTKNNITVEESTNSTSIPTLYINKVNTSTTLKGIEEAFIYKDIPIKNLKRYTRADGTAMTLVMFDLLSLEDKSVFLKNGILFNNQVKAVRDYINREKLIYKCFTYNKIGYLTKNCELKDKLCPKCNSKNCSDNCPKAIWKCTNCNGNHSAAYRGCPAVKSAITKSMNRRQNFSYAQAVCRRTAKEEIEAFQANVIINVHNLSRIITTVLWEINKNDFDTIDQLGHKVVQIIKQSVNSFKD